jgi:hypothetical protein
MMAAPGSKFWRRMRMEGRLLKTESKGRFFGDSATTNIIPKNMTQEELNAGLWKLKEELYNWEAFAVRAKGFVSNVKRRPNVPHRGYDWEFIFQFTGFLFSSLIDWKAKRIILGILIYTVKKAPFMLFPIMRMILRQFAYTNTVQKRQATEKQAEQKQTGPAKLEIEKSDTLVPEGFREPFKEIFPEVKKKVYQDLKDKTRIGETLIEIFTVFVRNWESSSEPFTDKHKSHIMELTERTIMEKNGSNGNQSAGLSCSIANFTFSTNDRIEPDVKKAPLSEDILRAIEQEMLMGECEKVT